MSELLTVSELAEFLKMTPRQIYTMTGTRTRLKQKHPLPVMRVNGNLRFDKKSVEAWLRTLEGVSQ